MLGFTGPIRSAVEQTVYAGTGLDNSLWVALMEKAFTFYRTCTSPKGTRINEGTYADIQGGGSPPVFATIGASSFDVPWTNPIETLSAIGRTLFFEPDRNSQSPTATIKQRGDADGSGQACGVRCGAPKAETYSMRTEN